MFQYLAQIKSLELMKCLKMNELKNIQFLLVECYNALEIKLFKLTRICQYSLLYIEKAVIC